VLDALPKAAKVVEVGPRDGLQSEPEVVPTEAKLAMIATLASSGLRHVEITSFVNPKWVPQLADAAEVARRAPRVPGCTFSALVPNARGLEGALACGVDEVVAFAAASESFSQKNTNRSVAEGLKAYREVIAEARAAGKPVRAYVSTAWVCPYEGPVAPEAVLRVAEALLEAGAYQVSLGDTIGAATPLGVQALVRQLAARLPLSSLALHFHDTRGLGLANVLAGLQVGVETFDASVGGLGGCPYAPGATGNVATEELVYLLESLGIATGVALPPLLEAGWAIQQVLGRKLPSRYLGYAQAAAAPPHLG
jgi:hydroxymethylglutaryl-CoA lyase